MLTQENTLSPRANDFAANGEAAMHAALTDMAFYGVGRLTNVFDESAMRRNFGVKIDYAAREKDHRIELNGALDPMLDAARRYVAYPEDTVVSAFVRHRNGSEGWHVDGTFLKRVDNTPHSYRFNSGLRFLLQLDGPDGYFAAISTNRNMQPGISSSDKMEMKPVPGSKFVVAPYLTGSVIVMSQSVDAPLGVESAERDIVRLEHPYHTGVQNLSDGFRTLAGVDLKLPETNFITGLRMPRGNMRTSL